MRRPLRTSPSPSHVVLRTHHEFLRVRKHLEMDAEANGEYGDWTPEWLIEAMQCRPRDSWRPDYDSWHAVRPSWEMQPDCGA